MLVFKPLWPNLFANWQSNDCRKISSFTIQVNSFFAILTERVIGSEKAWWINESVHQNTRSSICRTRKMQNNWHAHISLRSGNWWLPSLYMVTVYSDISNKCKHLYSLSLIPSINLPAAVGSKSCLISTSRNVCKNISTQHEIIFNTYKNIYRSAFC